MFQSPSLRGSGRFGGRLPPAPVRGRVSIPFIAGQWSLPVSTASRLDDAILFQSPSLRGSGRFSLNWFLETDVIFCFNPLHCGAVVASYPYIGCTI